MNQNQDFKLEETVDPSEVPKRLAFIKNETNAAVIVEEEDLVMSHPNLLWPLLIGSEILVIVLAIISLAVDAPLEEMANPGHTPNPAKAPWYFLGLQELLHLFPPFVAGVLIPTFVVIALIVIPYFEINIKREGLWETNQRATFYWLNGTVAVLVGGLAILKAFSILMPTILVYACMVWPYFTNKDSGLAGWFRRLSLAGWVMSWFVLVATVLTLIGILFRGPGWDWTWPWNGIY
jgi:lysylphosphatidylglycerol synthetase-like protein (DUF2156 family)